MTDSASPEERPLTPEEIAKLRGRTRSHLLDLAEYEDIIDRLIGMVVSVTDVRLAAEGNGPMRALLCRLLGHDPRWDLRLRADGASVKRCRRCKHVLLVVRSMFEKETE